MLGMPTLAGRTRVIGYVLPLVRAAPAVSAGDEGP
jgi:hypothetical protein